MWTDSFWGMYLPNESFSWSHIEPTHSSDSLIPLLCCLRCHTSLFRLRARKVWNGRFKEIKFSHFTGRTNENRLPTSLNHCVSLPMGEYDAHPGLHSGRTKFAPFVDFFKSFKSHSVKVVEAPILDLLIFLWHRNYPKLAAFMAKWH